MYDSDKLLAIFGGSFAGLVVLAIGYEIYRRWCLRHENELTAAQSNV